ncbi:cytochrome c oxidase assembly protein [Gilvimarinus sp. F26214L]|uniref:cytochrome c oxidase assembly protein n=1 Tax=Gilvimarinus sp. DZF01 TaxID=3461371 RepID=UPI00404685E5
MERMIFGIGAGLLVLTWLGPLPHLARHSFASHMTMHVLVLCVCAPMLAPFARRFLPLGGRYAALLAAAFELVVVWAWHLPRLHAAARHDLSGFALEQASYLLAGLAVWGSAFADRSPAGRARGVAGLLLTVMHMTLLGVLLALAGRTLYLHPVAASPLGLTAMQDQQLGGVIMLLVGGCSYLVGALYLLSRLLQDPATEELHVPGAR